MTEQNERKNAVLPPLVYGLQRFSKARVLIVGDVMLDAYLTGEAERISPEAPVPVVLITQEKRLLGGAGNVARNISSLGGKVSMVGVRGEDAAGEQLEAGLRADGVDYTLLPHRSRPTTVKTRIMARGQQMLRFDQEDAGPLEASDTAALLDAVKAYLPYASAVIVSDYGKGVVTEDFMRGLGESVRATGRDLPVLVDPKPRNFACYKGVTILTPNAAETGASVNMPVKSPADIIAAGRAIMRELHCPHLLTTLGARGMALFESPDSIWHIPTTGQQVFDVTGAGDTVIAALALGRAAGLSWIQSCLLANFAAGVVVGMVGAGTVSPDELLEAVRTLPTPNVAKWA
jgi:rfaE bifunctional protein kinase chain/domain